MKNVKIYGVLLLLCMGSYNVLLAQQPEHIYGMAKVHKSPEYYTEQKALWRKEVDKNPKDAKAWYNYYLAVRYAPITPNDGKNWQNTNSQELQKQVVKDMAKYVPNSLEYNYLRWHCAGLDMTQYPYLEKAYKMDPDNPLTWEDMATVAEIRRDTTLRNMLMKKLFNMRDIDGGIINFNYNVMAGLEPNAILLSFGDNDTYPVWQLQAARGFRKDITLINASLILEDEYRKKLFNTLGIPIAGMDTINFSKYTDFKKVLIQKLAQNNQNRPVYVYLTDDSSYTSSVKKDMYITGLAMKYSATKLDNMALLKKNFEQVYALDNLKMTFAPDASGGWVTIFNANYIVPMLTLYDHYKLSGETVKAEKMRQLVTKVATESGQGDEVKKYFDKN